MTIRRDAGEASGKKESWSAVMAEWWQAGRKLCTKQTSNKRREEKIAGMY